MLYGEIESMENTNTNAPGVGVSTAGAFTHASGNNLSEGVRKANEHFKGGGSNNSTSWHGSSNASTKPAETKSIDANTKADVDAKTTTAPTSDSAFDTSYLEPSYSTANTSYAASQASSDPFDTDYLNEASENVKNWNKMVEENAKKGNELAYTRGDLNRAAENYRTSSEEILGLQTDREENSNIIDNIRETFTGRELRPGTQIPFGEGNSLTTYEYSGSDPDVRRKVDAYNENIRRLSEVKGDIDKYGETRQGGISAAREAENFKNENNYLVRRAQNALRDGDFDAAERALNEYNSNWSNASEAARSAARDGSDENNPEAISGNIQAAINVRAAEAAREARDAETSTPTSTPTATPTATPRTTPTATPRTTAPAPTAPSEPTATPTSETDLSIPSNDELRNSIANAPESIADRAPASEETMDDIKRKHGWLGNDKDGASSFKDGKSKSKTETEETEETESVDELLEEGKSKYEGEEYDNWEKIVEVVAGKKGVEHVLRRKADVESLVENINAGNVKEAAKDLLTVGKDVAVDIIIAAATGGVGAVGGALKNVLLYTWNEMKATGFAPYTGDKANDNKNRLDAETIRMVDKFFGDDVTGADNLTVSTSNTSATKESDYNKGKTDETNDVVSDCTKKYIIANPWILKAIKKW